MGQRYYSKWVLKNFDRRALLHKQVKKNLDKPARLSALIKEF